MKALSIRQPWAWLILHAGKDVENREWQERNPAMHDARRLIGQRILIHTGKGMTRAEYDDAFGFAHAAGVMPWQLPRPTFETLPRGGIIGAATLKDIVFDTHPSPWFFGPVGLLLADVEPMPFRPLNGALGFFDVPSTSGGENGR